MMNEMGDRKMTAKDETYARALALARCEGLGERCRRYRRRAVVRRMVYFVVLLTMALFVARGVVSSVAGKPVAKGALDTDVAVENIKQMFLNR